MCSRCEGQQKDLCVCHAKWTFCRPDFPLLWQPQLDHMIFCWAARWIACILELKIPRCSRKHAWMWGEAKRYFGDVNFFCHAGGNQFSLCRCVVSCSQHQQSSAHQVSNEVAESCCLAKTEKWIMAINIVFRTAWLTKKAEAGGLRCQQHKLFQ